MLATELHISSIARLPRSARARVLAQLTEAEADELLHDWRFQAREDQIAPPGDWTSWLFLGGRGAGKTRAGVEWIREKVKAGAGHLGLIAPTAAAARKVIVEGESGILATAWVGDRDNRGNPMGRPSYEPSKLQLTWGNGAKASIFSAEEPERLRGPQHEALLCDELAAWADPTETWNMAMFGLRIGHHPQVMVTTTPKPIPLVRDLLKAPHGVVTKATTYANRAHLAPSFLSQIISKYEGTRLGRQELDAELLEDFPGALWNHTIIDKKRVAVAPDMARIVVAIDPSGTKGESDDGDSIGIVVAGKGVDGRGYVLADRTCKLSPDGWGRRAVAGYREFKADRIIAERNFGGAMVEHVIRTIDKSVSYKEVTASRGKVARAEPVAALYEQGKVSHVGSFPELEDQLCLMLPDGFAGEGSPDRADALVWALSELFFGGAPYGMLGVV